MRATVYVLTAAGLAMVGYGVYSGLRAAAESDAVDQMGHATWAAAGLVFGTVLLVAARRLWMAVPARSQADTPIAGFGRVTAVRDTGITVNGTTRVLEATVQVLAPGVDPFETNVTLRFERDETMVEPGSSLPLTVDRADHTAVSVDPEDVRRWLTRR